MNSNKLNPWMHFVLRFAGGYNILAGLGMMIFYHEGFKIVGIDKPDVNLPIQLVGLFVLLMGVGYLIVNRNPVENRNLLLIGFLSKALGPILACYYIFKGDLPIWMLAVLILADWIYVVPFWMIYRRLQRIRTSV